MRRSLVLLMVCLLGHALGPRQEAARARPALDVVNVRSGDVVRHPLLLLRGRLPDRTARAVGIRRIAADGDEAVYEGAAKDGAFKGLVELAEGTNQVAIEAGETRLDLVLAYRPQTNPYVVRAVYVTDSTGDTTYQSPDADDAQDYEARFATAMKLLQCFTADAMQRHGLGLRTFRLELDADGHVVVHTLCAPRPRDAYYALDDQAWYAETQRWLEGLLPTGKAKNVVLAAFTRFDPETLTVRGHTALGGGGQALFGSAGLFSWPTDVHDVLRAFRDTTAVDPARTHDDSAGRGTYWGLAATTMGATLHELGHTFLAPHTRDPYCIMTRGFDHLGRTFLLEEPPSRRRATPRPFRPSEEARWSTYVAGLLAASPWFALDEPVAPRGDGPSVSYDAARDRFVLDAPQGLAFVGQQVAGRGVEARTWAGDGDPPRHLELAIDDLPHAKTSPDTFALQVLDAAGRQAHASLHDLRPAPDDVRHWRFATTRRAWTDTTRLPPLEAAEIAALVDDARRGELKESARAYVDFLQLLDGPRTRTVAYALRTIESPEPREVVLHVGSDDAIRVWLNGDLVHEHHVLRGPAPDQDRVLLPLQAGANDLLIEVSQAGGGWGLYARLATPEGARLVLGSDGSLAPLRSTR